MALHRRPLFLRAQLTSLLACCSLAGCLFSWGGKDAEEDKPDDVKPPAVQGYYTIDFPAASSSVNLDSICTLKWRASDSAGNAPVRFFLYRNDSLLGEAAGSLLSSGSAEWDVAATKFLGDYRQGSGSDYRLRIVNYFDSAKWSLGPRFGIHSNYSGSLDIIAPVQGARALVDSALHIAWSRSGNVGADLGLQLYRGDDWVMNLTTLAPASEGEYSWPEIQGSLPSGDDYRIRLFSMADPSIDRLSPAFTIFSPVRTATYEILLPRSGDIWVGGGYARVDWTVTGNPGSVSVMTLWRDDPREFVMGWTAIDTYHPPEQLNVPADVPGGTYRVRVASLADSTQFGFSPPFIIQGGGAIE